MDEEGHQPGAEREELPGVPDISPDEGHRCAIAEHGPEVEEVPAFRRSMHGRRRTHPEEYEHDCQQRAERRARKGRTPAEPLRDLGCEGKRERGTEAEARSVIGNIAALAGMRA